MNTDKKNNEQINIEKDQIHSLILYNDDYHSFDYVIKALVQICALDPVQATQCTYLIHFKDNCEVKRGLKTILMPMQTELIRLDLKAEIK